MGPEAEQEHQPHEDAQTHPDNEKDADQGPISHESPNRYLNEDHSKTLP